MTMNEKPSIWVLLMNPQGDLCGAYLSKEALSKGVDHWMVEAEERNSNLVYYEWEADYIPEGISWDWAYVCKNANVYDLAQGGNVSSPLPEYKGINLIANKWKPIDDSEFDECYGSPFYRLRNVVDVKCDDGSGTQKLIHCGL